MIGRARRTDDGTYPDVEEELSKVDARAAVSSAPGLVRSEICGCAFKVTGERAFDCGCGRPSAMTVTVHLTPDRLRALITKNMAASLSREEIADALRVLDRIFDNIDMRKAQRWGLADLEAHIGRDVLEILAQGFVCTTG